MLNFYIFLGIYLAVLFAISFYISRKESKEDYLISGRDRKTWTILLSKFANSVGVNWFVVYTAYAYEFGIGIYGVLLGFIVGYLLFAFWAAPKIYKHSKKHHFYTQGDYVYKQTRSKFAKYLTNYTSVLVQFSWLLIGIVGGSKIISSVGLVSYEAALIITIGIILFYVVMAGYKAVLVTDVFQSIIIVLLLAFLGWVIIGDVSVSEILSAKGNSLDMTTAFGMFLYGLLSVFALADRYQLSYAANDEKSLKRGMALSIIPIIVVASFLLLIGLFMYIQNPNLDPALAFIEAIKTRLPSSLIPIGLVLFFAGLMSNSDTSIFAISSHIVFSKKQSKPVRSVRFVTVVALIGIGLISYFFRDIVDITVFAAVATVVLSVPMIYLLVNGESANRFIGSIMGGVLGLILGVMVLGLVPTLIVVVVIGGMLGVFVGGFIYKDFKKI